MRATWRKELWTTLHVINRRTPVTGSPVPSPRPGRVGLTGCRERLCPGQTPRTDGLRAQSVQQETQKVPTHVVPQGLELLGHQAHLVRHRALLQGQCGQLLPQAFQLALQPPQLLHEALPEGLLRHPTPKERSVGFGSLVRGKAMPRKARGAPHWLLIMCAHHLKVKARPALGSPGCEHGPGSCLSQGADSYPAPQAQIHHSLCLSRSHPHLMSRT